MTPIELATTCAHAMAGGPDLGVVLTIPKGGMPRTFPRGELLNERQVGKTIERTYHFKPARVLDWMVANGLVVIRKVEGAEGGVVVELEAAPGGEG